MMLRRLMLVVFSFWLPEVVGPSARTNSQAEPLLEKLDLFEAGKEGYALYRSPGLVVTKAGTVLAYCEARRTGKSDWDTIDLMLRRSIDGGRTWSP
jgi:sialidase-1